LLGTGPDGHAMMTVEGARDDQRDAEGPKASISRRPASASRMRWRWPRATSRDRGRWPRQAGRIHRCRWV